ncbi:unnamed protein product [Linum tenue]|uniref:Uncharacterized protein n=1 Tax=Linum tenue TaxID=586396 RepID=A0AAV0JY71_9ROSI|nr:unnamed protein product [Linum tenue]
MGLLLLILRVKCMMARLSLSFVLIRFKLRHLGSSMLSCLHRKIQFLLAFIQIVKC